MSLFKRLSLYNSHVKRYFYDWRTLSDSIFAPSTSIDSNKGSPLGIIRVSGSKTPDILKTIIGREPLRSDGILKDGKSISCIKPRYATLSKITDPNNKELIDTGLVLWFPQPNSYTGEDSCEFHIHGSKAIMQKLLTVLGSLDGMRPAEPGEFTRRAVANGKLDIIQAESLSDLISSKTDRQRQLALKGLTGTTRAKYQDWIERLVRILAHLEASIDFGEDELIGEQQVVRDCQQSLVFLFVEISNFITLTKRCKDLTELGAQVAILGQPNAGKSTFMNILCRQEKSIVSKMSGTTRDLIKHSLELGGHKLSLCDTAGLSNVESVSEIYCDENQEPSHEDIEREGIRRAIEAAHQADLIIYIYDFSQIRLKSMSEMSREIVNTIRSIKLKQKQQLIHLVMNKIDLSENASNEFDSLDMIATLKDDLDPETDIQVSMISCLNHTNINEMIEKLVRSLDKLQSHGAESKEQALEYVNERHLSLLISTRKHLDKAKDLNINRIDEMAQHVREAIDYLSRIIGTVSNDQVIDIIFRDFCIGK